VYPGSPQPPQFIKTPEKKKELRFLNPDLARQIELAEVSEFVVTGFYRQLADTGVRLRMSEDFMKLIVEPQKYMKISLPPSKLNRDVLKVRAYDSEIETDFSTPPVIPVKTFLAQLKMILEAQSNGEQKDDGLDIEDGNTNIFHVDLGNDKVISVRLRLGREEENRPGQEQHKGEWLVLAVPLADEKKKHPRTPGCVFFSPAK